MLLERLPPSEERDRTELDLCSSLVRVLQVTKGYSAPETMQLGAHARALAERLGDVAQLVRQGARTWASIFFTGDYATAASLAKEILDIALTEGPNSSHLFFAHYAQVQARFYAGDISGVEEYFAKLSPMLDTKSISAASYLIIPIGVASRAAWQAGRLDLARERMSRAMDLAKKSGDPYAMAMALHFKAISIGVSGPRDRWRLLPNGFLPFHSSTGSITPRIWRVYCSVGPNRSLDAALKAWN